MIMEATKKILENGHEIIKTLDNEVVADSYNQDLYDACDRLSQLYTAQELGMENVVF
jgi:hypothetical protein